MYMYMCVRIHVRVCVYVNIRTCTCIHKCTYGKYGNIFKDPSLKFTNMRANVHMRVCVCMCLDIF